MGIVITALLFFGGIILTVLINALLAPTVKTPQKVISEIIDLMNLKRRIYS